MTWRGDEDLGLPAVEWPFGEPDVSNEWVAALFDAFVAIAAAHNAHDFSGPAVAQRVGHEYLEMSATDAARYASPQEPTPSSYLYYPGPHPFVVTDLDAGRERAVATACLASRWWGPGGPALTVTELRAVDSGTVWRFELVRGDDGLIRLTADLGPDELEWCDIGDLRMGYFRPPPPYEVGVLKQDVIGVDGQPVVEEWIW